MNFVLNAWGLTDNTLSIVIDGKPYSIVRGNPNFDNAIKALKEKEIGVLLDLVDVSAGIVVYTSGKVNVRDGSISYNGKKLHGVLVDKVLDFKRNNFPFEGLVKFIEKLYQNPSQNSIEQLYGYICRNKLPICDDGDFLAYKAIRADWKDKHSGTIDNSVGNVVKMDRSLVDDNHNADCSHGLHIGAHSYVKDHAKLADDRFVLCKINPINVVSVPHDSSFRKIRVCEYLVYSEVDRSEFKEFNRDYYDNLEEFRVKRPSAEVEEDDRDEDCCE